MKFKIPASLPVQMLLALISGLAVGLISPRLGGDLQLLGTAFIEALKMVVVPLVFSMVALGVWKMGAHIGELGRIALVAFGWFYLSTILLALLALGLDAIFHPGIGAKLVETGKIPPNLAISINWVQYLLDLIPSNIVSAMAGQNLMPVLVFATILGAALSRIGDAADPLIALLTAVQAAMFKIVHWIIALTPIAIFGISAWLVATQGASTIFSLINLIAITYLAIAVAMIGFLMVLLVIGENLGLVIRKMLEPVALGFMTRSSEVALPIHIEKLREMSIPDRIVTIVLPLGYSFNLAGSILYLVLATCFLAEAYGVPLNASALTTVLITGTLASKGIANIPSGGLVALTTVVTAVGLPPEAIALIAGVDLFMDMGRTATNIFGNTVAVLLVRRFNGNPD